ncbi:MCE family protein [Alcaligenaceae bacterium LF4-65]|jgi:paraquat-inducible protein B|uniref:MCE family protein n=1 Tax=Zwartia hollandica TaxID=324606 RepID=A0A953N7B6_9BURK|nr:MlaD family protein [Zwartia hollandica]MBZ1349348.1 MCE family protein [Zwartia hollandica]
MPEQSNSVSSKPLPRVGHRPKRNLAWVWLIPIVAAVVGASIIWSTVSKQGPRITISFQSADGLEVGKTQIRYRSVVIGTVKEIRLSPDRDKVLVSAELTNDASGFAREDTTFWVVKPRIGLGGVSGLSTLISGSYIESDTGKSSASQASKKSFVGLEQPPPIASDRPGKRFVLRSPNLGSLAAGSPVFYRRIPVGLVTGYRVAEAGKSVDLDIFIDAPFDAYVDGSTRFWDESGFDVTISADGMQLNTQSLVSLIAGGLSFSSFGKSRPLVGDPHIFKLYDSKRMAELVPEGVAVPIVMKFHQPARGLKVGAPVDFHGVHIGIINSVDLDLDLTTRRFFTSVEATLYPERLGKIYSETTLKENTPQDLAESLSVLVKRGLRAQLRTSNILTGQLYVALATFPEAPVGEAPVAEIPFKIPTFASDDLDKLQQQVTSIVSKLDKIPFETIGQELDAMIKQIRVLSANLDKSVTPKLSSTLAEIERATKSLNSLIAPGSPVVANTEAMLEDLRRSLKSLTNLTESLSANPDSLIRGRSTQPYSRETLGAPGK